MRTEVRCGGGARAPAELRRGLEPAARRRARTRAVWWVSFDLADVPELAVDVTLAAPDEPPERFLITDG